MKNRPSIVHLLAIGLVLAALAAGTFLYTNANEPVEGLPDARPPLTYRVYFGNSELDPDAACDKVFPVERPVPLQDAITSAAIEELAAGPTAEEAAAGYFTSLAPGTRIVGVRDADEDSATYVFSPELDEGVAGSCRVLAIRAQIEATLKDAVPWLREIGIATESASADETLQP